MQEYEAASAMSRLSNVLPPMFNAVLGFRVRVQLERPVAGFPIVSRHGTEGANLGWKSECLVYGVIH